MKSFDVEFLRKNLTSDKDRKIVYYDLTDSTNTRLLEDIIKGTAKAGDIYIAKEQSAGRGRRGKSFSSPNGGIYMSFCVNNTEYGLSTVKCGVAVADALSFFGFEPEIKWVNDVLIGGKKVCGILAQSAGELSLAAMGVGINLYEKTLGGELKDIATALDAVGDKNISREKLISEVVNRYEAIERSDVKDVINRYKKYMTMLGEHVIIKETEEVCTAVDVDLDGALIVSFNNGTLRRLNSGEISVRKTNI